MIGGLHKRLVYGRRTNVLAHHLSEVIPRDATVLDIGAGDGVLQRKLVELRPDLRVKGIDLVVRAELQAPVAAGDGARLAFADREFDVALLIDVLHHDLNATALLREAVRVSKRCVIIKDHIADSRFAYKILSLMDWVGNARYGVPLPYAYFSSAEWTGRFRELGLRETERREALGLYPWPASLLFERGLHFLTVLDATRA